MDFGEMDSENTSISFGSLTSSGNQHGYESGFVKQERSVTDEEIDLISSLKRKRSLLKPEGVSSVERSSQNSFHLTSPYIRTSGNLNNANRNGVFRETREPFTPSQWLELEHQALIYRYMLANVPIPPDLLIPIIKALNTSKENTWNFDNNIQEWLLMFTSLVLEGLSSFFEQLDYPLLGMVMAITGFLVCIVEIFLKARTERVTIEWRSSLPLFYSHYPNYKLFGSTIQYFGLVAAIWQCFHSSLGYIYACKNLENPIRMTIIMFLFCICLIISKIIKKYSNVTPLWREGSLK